MNFDPTPEQLAQLVEIKKQTLQLNVEAYQIDNLERWSEKDNKRINELNKKEEKLVKETRKLTGWGYPEFPRREDFERGGIRY